MGIRQRVYWLRQAAAVERRFIANVSYGVRIGMADSNDYDKAMKGLELEPPKTGLRDSMIGILSLFGGGKGV